MTDEVLNERALEMYIGGWKLIPTRGGLFEVTVNGELLFSKKQLGRHSEPNEIRNLIARKLDEVLPDRPRPIEPEQS